MSELVSFTQVSTEGLESSPVADALAGLRANEARYFKNKYDHDFRVDSADDARAIVNWVAEYPFPGWNQGFNTCTPLIYLLGGWFRHMPARIGNPFDVIPVDFVCRGLVVAGAEMLLGQHSPVYQCGSSDRNLLTIDRAIELTALAHRRHLRDHGGSRSARTCS